MVAISQVQFLDNVMVIFTGAVVQKVYTVWRCRSCSSSFRTLASLSRRRGFSHGAQTVQLIIEISPVAVPLVVAVPVVQVQGPQVHFCGGGRRCVVAATSSSCRS